MVTLFPTNNHILLHFFKGIIVNPRFPANSEPPIPRFPSNLKLVNGIQKSKDRSTEEFF